MDEKGLLIADGLDHAFVGLMMRFNVLEPIACYDYDRVIQGYIEEGMTEEEAIEFFEFNVIGAYAGPRTPCYVQRIDRKSVV